MRGTARSLLAGALLTALALLGSACTVPTGGPPNRIAPSEIPYGLASPEPSEPAVTSGPTSIGQPRIYLVTDQGTLVASGRSVAAAPLPDRLASLLTDLAGGPSADERAAHLSTSLPPAVRLGVAGVSGSTATIDISGPREGPSGKEGRRAVAQIVLTATSLPGIDAVLLVSGGTPLEAPLPSGELTSAELTAADYSGLVATPAPPT